MGRIVGYGAALRRVSLRQRRPQTGEDRTSRKPRDRSGTAADFGMTGSLEEDGSVIPSVEELALLPMGDDGEEDYLGGNGTEWSPGL